MFFFISFDCFAVCVRVNELSAHSLIDNRIEFGSTLSIEDTVTGLRFSSYGGTKDVAGANRS